MTYSCVGFVLSTGGVVGFDLAASLSLALLVVPLAPSGVPGFTEEVVGMFDEDG